MSKTIHAFMPNRQRLPKPSWWEYNKGPILKILCYPFAWVALKAVTALSRLSS